MAHGGHRSPSLSFLALNASHLVVLLHFDSTFRNWTLSGTRGAGDGDVYQCHEDTALPPKTGWHARSGGGSFGGSVPTPAPQLQYGGSSVGGSGARTSPPMMEEVDPSPQPAVVMANSSDGGASGSGAHPSSAAVSKESFLKILSNLPGPGPRDHDGEDTVTEVDFLFDMIDQYMKSPEW